MGPLSGVGVDQQAVTSFSRTPLTNLRFSITFPKRLQPGRRKRALG